MVGVRVGIGPGLRLELCRTKEPYFWTTGLQTTKRSLTGFIVRLLQEGNTFQILSLPTLVKVGPVPIYDKGSMKTKVKGVILKITSTQRGRGTQFKRPDGDVPPTWMAKLASWDMNESL